MMNRRTFFKHSATALAGALVARSTPSLWAKSVGANGDIRIAIIGLGNMGNQHADVYGSLPGCRVVALCDVDPKRLAAQVAKRQKPGTTYFATTDARKVLERDDVDAIVIAAPNHWHALLTVWALEAGKDVYVEKPVSHSLWEGAQLLAAEKKYSKRIIQAGTHLRSDTGLREAAAWLAAGKIGKPKWGHVVWYEQRPSIGRRAPYTPDWLDYDLFCGPAPLEPLTRDQLHYDWHWVWSTGDGDLCNSGIHAFDVCRWFAGVGLPRRVCSLGGRFAVDDAGQTPNTQLTLVDYPGMPVIIENRNLPRSPNVKAMDVFRNTVREGFALHFEGGYFLGMRGGGWIHDNDGKRVKQFQGDGGGTHKANFLEAVRSRKHSDLRAPLLQGHVSTAVCQAGNISYRVGRAATAADCRAAVTSHPEAAGTLQQLEQNVAANGIDLAKTPMTLGPWVELSPEGVKGVSTGDAAQLKQAQAIARGAHRAPYTW